MELGFDDECILIVLITQKMLQQNLYQIQMALILTRCRCLRANSICYVTETV
jgi:hypothetical protein